MEKTKKKKKTLLAVLMTTNDRDQTDSSRGALSQRAPHIPTVHSRLGRELSRLVSPPCLEATRLLLQLSSYLGKCFYSQLPVQTEARQLMKHAACPSGPSLEHGVVFCCTVPHADEEYHCIVMLLCLPLTPQDIWPLTWFWYLFAP